MLLFITALWTFLWLFANKFQTYCFLLLLWYVICVFCVFCVLQFTINYKICNILKSPKSKYIKILWPVFFGDHRTFLQNELKSYIHKFKFPTCCVLHSGQIGKLGSNIYLISYFLLLKILWFVLNTQFLLSWAVCCCCNRGLWWFLSNKLSH